MNRQFNKFAIFGTKSIKPGQQFTVVETPSFQHDEQLFALWIHCHFKYVNSDTVNDIVGFAQHVLKQVAIKMSHFLEKEIVRDLDLEDICMVCLERGDDYPVELLPAQFVIPKSDYIEKDFWVKLPYRNWLLANPFEIVFPIKEISELKYRILPDNINPKVTLDPDASYIEFAFEYTEFMQLQHYGIVTRIEKQSIENRENKKVADGMFENIFYKPGFDVTDPSGFKGFGNTFTSIIQDGVGLINNVPDFEYFLRYMNENIAFRSAKNFFINLHNAIIFAGAFPPATASILPAYSPIMQIPIVFSTNRQSTQDLPDGKVDFSFQNKPDPAGELIICEMIKHHDRAKRESYVSCGKDVLEETEPDVNKLTAEPLNERQLERIAWVKRDRKLY